MLSEWTHRRRQAVAEAERVLGPNRFVDFGVRLHVVRQDVDAGRVVVPGRAPVVSLRTHELGGVVDTQLREFIGPSERPQIWYCSEEAEPLVLHNVGQPNLLVYGAMGAGKTRGVLALWLLLRVIELTGFDAEVGGTAPTEKRLTMLVQAVHEAANHSWFDYRVKDKLFLFRNGVRMRLVTTAYRSAEQGSPVQGWNWAACGSDEIQDSLRVDSDIEARGRAAPVEIGYLRCATATAKDAPEWRTKRDEWRTSGLWHESHLAGPSNPFVDRDYWERLKQTMSPREYRRKVLALDVGPERATYPQWSRAENLRPRPDIGMRDVTRSMTGGYAALLGHDPGSLFDVTLVLRCYEDRAKKLRAWWVVDEITTAKTTTEAHIAAVTRRLQQVWKLQRPGDDEPKVIVRCDPQGDSDSRTHVSVYRQWKLSGYHILSAAYTPQGKPTGRVPKEAGIDLINTLLCNEAGERRLFVDCDARRKPAAPHLVRALEMSERDEKGDAEVKTKGKEDLSHWCAALRYALWKYERVRVNDGLSTGGALV